MKSPVDEKLAFEAVRYIFEEMPPSERQAFEDRLMEDQAAREAVADAVAVCGVVKEMFDRTMAQAEQWANWRPPEFLQAAEFIQPAVSHEAGRFQSAAAVDSHWRRPTVWASLALAASVMIAVVLWGVGRHGQRRALHVAKNVPARSGSAETSQPGLGSDFSIRDLSTHDSSTRNSLSRDGMTDHGKQLAVAWFQFLPSPNDLSSQADADALDGDDFGGDGLDTTITAADDDEVAWADSTAVTAGDTGASPTDDWLFEAVTAPAAESASPPVTPLEG